VLQQGGGGLNALGRQTVAALLSAAHPDVAYPFTPDEVISMFDDVFPGSRHDYRELKDRFEDANEQDCPLDKHDDDDDKKDRIHDFWKRLWAWWKSLD
jgi:hypothetical protein